MDTSYNKIKTDTNSWKQWLPISFIMGLALVLRLYQLGTEGLLYDEMLSFRDAENFQFTFPYNRPLYFILLQFWMQFGQSEAWLRSLSIPFAIGAIFLTYLLGCRVLGKSTGLMAALMMTLSPLFINHAQEIRFYSLICFLSVAGTLALCYALERPTYPAILWWTVTRILLLVSNANNVLILLPDTLLIAWKYRNKLQEILKFGTALLLICLSFVPILMTLFGGDAYANYMATTAADYSKPGLLVVLGELTQVTVYWPLRHLMESSQIVLATDARTDTSLLKSLFSFQALELLFYAGFTLILLGILGIALLSLVVGKKRSDQLRWIATWALLPTICTLVMSYVSDPIWKSRYLLFIDPYFLILLAAGFLVIWNWRRKLAVGIAIAYFVAVSGGLLHYYATLYRNDWPGAIQAIESNEKPGDVGVIYSRNISYEYSFEPNYEGQMPIYSIQFYDQVARFEKNPESFLVQGERDTTTTPDRLWLACWEFCDDPAGIDRIFKQFMGEQFQIEKRQVFDSLEYPIEVFMVTSNSQQKPKPSLPTQSETTE